MITLSPLAIRDRAAIYTYTAEQWSEDQAEEYADFLDAVIRELAESPASAPLVPKLKGVRSYTARWKNAQQGHSIFYEEVEGGIYVFRLLHTAMNWSDHLDAEI